MDRLPGFASYAFVRRTAANVALVHAWPEDSAPSVHDAVERMGLDASLVGPGPEAGRRSAPGAVLCTRSRPFRDDDIGDLSDELTLSGIGSYAYTLVHDDIAGTEVGAYARLGHCQPHEGAGVVLVHTFVLAIPEGIGATTWVFGSRADLAQVMASLCATFDTDAIRDPTGIAALEVHHLELAAGLGTPPEAQRSLVRVLGHEGFEGPVLMTDTTARGAGPVA